VQRVFCKNATATLIPERREYILNIFQFSVNPREKMKPAVKTLMKKIFYFIESFAPMRILKQTWVKPQR
jgi:hypothetical protein